MQTQINQPLYSIVETLSLLKIGKTKFYEELAAGRIKAVKSGQRTLVPAQAIKDWIKIQNPPRSGSIFYDIQGEPEKAWEKVAMQSNLLWPVHSSFNFDLYGETIEPNEWRSRHCEISFNSLGFSDLENFEAQGFIGECQIFHRSINLKLFLKAERIRDVLMLWGLPNYNQKTLPQIPWTLDFKLIDLEKNSTPESIKAKISGVRLYDLTPEIIYE